MKANEQFSDAYTHINQGVVTGGDWADYAGGGIGVVPELGSAIAGSGSCRFRLPDYGGNREPPDIGRAVIPGADAR